MHSKNKRAIDLLQDLIRIPSENPGGTEKEIANYIVNFFSSLGYAPEIVEYVQDRSNVVCMIKADAAKKTILLSPHIDTVPAGSGWKHDPFAGIIVGKKLYGRGAADCKINAAVAMEVLRQLSEGDFKLQNLNILFAATADEETGSHHGFVPLIKELPFCDYSLILDGDDFSIGNAQKGLLHVKIDIGGIKAHGAYLELGDNAVIKTVNVYSRIQAWVKRYNSENKKAQITLNLGKIHGGDKVNMVPDLCTIELDLRFLSPMKLKYLVKEIKSLVKEVDKKAKVTILHQQKESFCDKSSMLVKVLKKTLKKQKKKVKFKLFKGATVLSFLPKKSQAVIIGFGDANVFHMTNEHVKVKNITDGVEFLKEFLLDLDKSIYLI